MFYPKLLMDYSNMKALLDIHKQIYDIWKYVYPLMFYTKFAR